MPVLLFVATEEGDVPIAMHFVFVRTRHVAERCNLQKTAYTKPIAMHSEVGVSASRWRYAVSWHLPIAYAAYPFSDSRDWSFPVIGLAFTDDTVDYGTAR